MGFGFNTVSLILILISFVFLLLATISTPVVNTFNLASTSAYTYGALGFCSARRACTSSSAGYPYDVGSVEPRLDWLLDESTRNNLAKALIITPIAAGINLICFVFVLLSHFFSSGVIIFSIVINVIAFLITTVIAILVILMFHPYVSWTGWILIGSAAATLISIVFLFLALKLNPSGSEDESDVESVNEMTTFDNKFGSGPSGFMPPTSNFNRTFNNNYNDNSSSISKDYEYKPTPINNKSNTMTSSSIYNSNPQLAKDFTQHNNNSFGSKTDGSHYEDAQVNFVNGPNTPVSSHQQMAPSFVPNVATPTTNDLPESRIPQLPGHQVPYPTNRPLNKPPYTGADISVFEHHPEVEGHRPFTELDDDLGPQPDSNPHYNHRGSQASDLSDDSDFTSVSQRAPNPRYNQGYQGYQPDYFQQQQFQTYPQQQPFQPQFQQVPPPMMNQQMPPAPMNQAYFSPAPQPQRFAAPRPQVTASDNALANNPDFALGMGARKKPGMNKPGLGPSRMGIPGLGTPGMKRPQGQGGPGRGGPYGMM